MIPGQHLDATLTKFEKVGVHNKIVSGLAVGNVLVVDRVHGKVVRVNGQVVRQSRTLKFAFSITPSKRTVS